MCSALFGSVCMLLTDYIIALKAIQVFMAAVEAKINVSATPRIMLVNPDICIAISETNVISILEIDIMAIILHNCFNLMAIGGRANREGSGVE